MNDTVIISTEDEQGELRSLAASARIAGMLSSRFGPYSADIKTHEAHERCHAMALEHGLPEIDGFYGMDEKGQFVSEERPTTTETD